MEIMDDRGRHRVGIGRVASVATALICFLPAVVLTLFSITGAGKYEAPKPWMILLSFLVCITLFLLHWSTQYVIRFEGNRAGVLLDSKGRVQEVIKDRLYIHYRLLYELYLVPTGESVYRVEAPLKTQDGSAALVTCDVVLNLSSKAAPLLLKKDGVQETLTRLFVHFLDSYRVACIQDVLNAQQDLEKRWHDYLKIHLELLGHGCQLYRPLLSELRIAL